MTSSSAPLSPTLIADIGGTNARFAIVDSGRLAGEPLRISTSGHPDIETALTGTILPALGRTPRSAVFALAAAIEGDRVQLTNGDWVIDPARLIEELRLDEVSLFNDFEALALSLPHLAERDAIPIGGGISRPDAIKLVIGAGTGLGVAAMIPVGSRWLPVATEGGHVDFGPVDRRDFEIWPHLIGAGGRISAEMLMSGEGIERLYLGVSRANGTEAASLSAAEIVDRAGARSDEAAVETIDLFCAYLGRFAGSMALTFLARGGVLIGGGIAPRIAGQIAAGRFRRAFEDKHPFTALVGSIGTSLIVHPEPALLGLAAWVADPGLYLVDLSKRTWRR